MRAPREPSWIEGVPEKFATPASGRGWKVVGANWGPSRDEIGPRSVPTPCRRLRLLAGRRGLWRRRPRRSCGRRLGREREAWYVRRPFEVGELARAYHDG